MLDITLKQVLRETSLNMLELDLTSVPINIFYYIKRSINKSFGSDVYVDMLTRDVFDVPDIYPDLFEVRGYTFLVTGNTESIRKEITDTVPVESENLFGESIQSVLKEYGGDSHKNDKGRRSWLHQNR